MTTFLAHRERPRVLSRAGLALGFVLGAALGVACSGADVAPGIPAGEGAADAGFDAVAPIDGASGGDASLPPPTGPRRLSIKDAQISDDRGQPIRLRGANLEGVDAAEATELADVLHMNVVRLRVSWEGANRDDRALGSLSAAYRAQLDGWVTTLAKERIWVVLEVRTDDATANAPDLYTPTSATFAAYKELWRYLASTYKSRDYIGGYGLLAEPSPDKAGVSDPVSALTSFQEALMDTITKDAGDTITPFFVGAAFNYDGLDLWRDAYHSAHVAYQGRLVYEVNILTPKPWIDTGLSVDGSTATYPVSVAPPIDYDTLLSVKPGESFKLPEQSPKVFNKRMEEPASFGLALTPGFVSWYLARPLAFRARHKVPLYVDQFGAGTVAGGQLAYEQNLITYFESHDIHWTRWAYNAGSPGRRIKGNATVVQFYKNQGFPHP